MAKKIVSEDSHSLINGFAQYLKYATSLRKSKDSKDRYRQNRFIYHFSLVLKLVLHGRYQVTSVGKYIKLERKGPPVTGFSLSEKYMIYGRTNKSIIKKVENLCIQGANLSLDELGDLIFDAYQKKRKYPADTTLEEIIDLSTFTGEDVSEIISKNSTQQSAVKVYFTPDDFQDFERLVIDVRKKSASFPLLAIPAYAIVVYVTIECRLPNEHTRSEWSKNIYTFNYADPLGAIEKDSLEGFFRRFATHKIDAIQENYSTIFANFEDVSDDVPIIDDKTKPTYVHYRVEHLDVLDNTNWHKELEHYEQIHRSKDANRRQAELLRQIKKMEESEKLRKAPLADILAGFSF